MLRAEINPAPSSAAVPPGLRAGWPAVTVFLRLKSVSGHMTSTKVSWLKLGKSQANLDGWSPELWVILEFEESYGFRHPKYPYVQEHTLSGVSGPPNPRHPQTQG